MDSLVSNISAQNESKDRKEEVRVYERERQADRDIKGKGIYQSDSHQNCSRIIAYLLHIQIVPQTSLSPVTVTMANSTHFHFLTLHYSQLSTERFISSKTNRLKEIHPISY